MVGDAGALREVIDDDLCRGLPFSFSSAGFCFGEGGGMVPVKNDLKPTPGGMIPVLYAYSCPPRVVEVDGRRVEGAALAAFEGDCAEDDDGAIEGAGSRAASKATPAV